MNSNRHTELNIFFDEAKKQSYLIFKQLYILRNSIKNHEEVEFHLKKLKNLFDNNLIFKSNLFNSDEILGLNNKCNDFFYSYLLSRGQKSKGKLDFFDESLNNLSHYGVIESNLSKMRKKMEIAWYGILQQYGKLLIKSAKG